MHALRGRRSIWICVLCAAHAREDRNAVEAGLYAYKQKPTCDRTCKGTPHAAAAGPCAPACSAFSKSMSYHDRDIYIHTYIYIDMGTYIYMYICIYTHMHDNMYI